MSTGPRIANWQIVRPIGRVGRLTKYIDIPAFSEQCFKPNCSLYLSSQNAEVLKSTHSISGDTGFTFECWIKNISPITSSNQLIVANLRNTELDYQWSLSVDYNRLKFTWLDANSLTDVSVYSIDYVPHGEWCHVYVSFGVDSVVIGINGQVTTTFYGSGTDFFVDGAFFSHIDEGLKLYVDGVEVLTSDELAMGTSAGGYTLNIGPTNEDAPNAFSGYIAELRLWNVVQTYENISYKYNKPRNSEQNNDIDDELECYYSMTNGVLAGSTWTIANEIATGGEIVTNNDTNPIVATEFPPLVYGGSFVPLVFHVISPVAHSLKHPVTKPTDCNFGLYVAWTDEDGSFQRRELFTSIGVDIKPDALKYHGERLPQEYDIEVWNIDGIDNVTMTETLQILTSVTASMTSMEDRTPVALTTLTEDSQLAEPFPLTGFPLTFNQQQTY